MESRTEAYEVNPTLDREWEDQESRSAQSWRTALAKALPTEKLISGYPLHDLTGNVTYTEVIYLQLKGELPDERATAMLDACLTTIIDHGMRSACSVAARFVASSNPDPLAAILAGMHGIGSRSAGAQRYTIELIERGLRLQRGEGLSVEEAAAQIVDRYLSEEGKLPGFGTITQKRLGYDPRTLRLRELAERYGYADSEPVRFYGAVHRALEARRGRPVVMNPDGIMGAVFAAMGFTAIEAAALEAVVMLPSIMGHAVEEIRQRNPYRLLPHALVEYIGPPRRELPPGKKRI